MDRSDDSQLAVLAKKGDWDAFEELVFRYGGKLFGFAFFYVRNREDARDISQETFFRVYRGLRRYDARKPFFSWFYAVFLNTLRDYRRKNKPAASVMENDLENIAWSGNETMTPEEKICLFQAMDCLDEEDQCLLMLRFFEGANPAEIAERFGISENNAGVRLHRAKENLKRELLGTEYEHG